MLRFARFAVLLAAVGLATSMLAGCNDDSALPPAGKYSAFSGTVIDRATNKPLAGAVVTVDTVLTATTDATGKFTIAKVPSGIVDYSVQANGYAVLTSTANTDPGKPFELDVSLDPSPPH